MAKKGTVLITGGAKRIGRAIALSLGQDGYNIALHYNNSEKEAEKVCKEILASGAECEIFQCDLSNQRAVGQLIENVKESFADLNVLINNASVFEASKIKSATMESFDQHMNINLKAPFILTKDFAKHCGKGHIINILDAAIVNNDTTHTTYLLSKKGLAELTKISAIELAPDILVNGIAPGFILPPKDGGDAYAMERTKNIPFGRQGDVKNITGSIRFILSQTYFTGQIIFNDGGEHLLGHRSYK